MIVLSTERIRAIKPSKNCRVQSLWYLLTMKGVTSTPQILYLLCPKPLYSFSNIRNGKVSFPFLGSFYPDVEDRFLKETGLIYGIGPTEVEFSEICSVLDNGDSRILLCDADSILKHGADSKNPRQVGVCSSIFVVGYDDCNKSIFIPHSTQAERYETISFDLLSYARNRVVLPSSPLATSIWVKSNVGDTKPYTEKVCDYRYLLSSLRNQLLVFAESSEKMSAQYTNNGTIYFIENAAISELLQFFDDVRQTIGNNGINEEIKNRVFVLKLMMLRKSMISGTETFNRLEIADSINELYEISKDPLLKELYEGFLYSSTIYRNIIRILYFTYKNINDKAKHLNTIQDLFIDAITHERKIVNIFLDHSA